VVVTASANPQLDFANTTTGLVVDVETLTKRSRWPQRDRAWPCWRVGHPGARPSFNNSPSGRHRRLGRENAFYVNGLNITNFNNGIGGAPCRSTSTRRLK
jgi:hypothetical protein